jgi:DUF4097 and DUF4098 domain-containing protein YvlB
VLIVLGLLFLAHNFGARIPIWHYFGRFWPVLLILWGVIKLAEHASASRQGYRTSGIGGGTIFLLLLIIVLGVTARHTSDWNWGGVRDQIQIDDDFGGMFGGNAYSYDDMLQQTFPGDGNLRIVSDHGAITVQPSDDDSIKVIVHKKVYAENQKDADKYNQGTKPILTVNGTSVLLNANTNGAGEHGVSADMEVFVPRKAGVDIASRRGDLNITDRKGGLKLSAQHGDIVINGVEGGVKINLEKGSIRTSKIVGPLDIDGRIDDVTIDDVDGPVRLNGDYFNDIRVSKVNGPVTFKSARSDITIAGVPGDLEISGESLRGTDVDGPSRMVMRSKEVHLEDVKGDLELESTNGDIEVHAANKLPLGKMTITGKKGSVTLVLPPNAGFELDATTRRGDISSDFANIKIDEESGGTKRASGTVGNGAAKLIINAEKGDINISKS